MPVLFGLFSEVGSVMATSKKLHREGDVYVGHRDAAIEELGDTFWYLAAVCRRLGIDLNIAISESMQVPSAETVVLLPESHYPGVALGQAQQCVPNLEIALSNLGISAAQMLGIPTTDATPEAIVKLFIKDYLDVLTSANLSLGLVVSRNAAKACGRFLNTNKAELPIFDDEFEEDEQIPRKFEIHIRERGNGRSYLQMNGVFIGEPLSDNIADPDGYRFHDVFHLAHAAVLHWSPVFRALTKRKRKSDAAFDEEQDGGRAIVVEEGLTAWVFTQAKELGFFREKQSLPFDVLKTIQNFVMGYEVQKCPLKLWEDAILQGYKAFNLVKQNRGGILVGDLDKRTLTYQRLKS